MHCSATSPLENKMKSFDPVHLRDILDGASGYCLNLSSDVNSSRTHSALGHAAHMDANDAVGCILVGRDRPANLLLDQAHDRLLMSINEKERREGDQPHTEYQRHHDLADCVWLMTNVHDQENLDLCAFHLRLCLIESRTNLNKTNVGLSVIAFVDAGSDEAALEVLAAAKVKGPRTAGDVRSENQMVHMICNHRLNGAWSSDEVESSLAKFLKRSMNTWLLDGHYLRAAEWLKVAHWRKGGPLTAKQAVMKAYDYLPGVNRPPTEDSVFSNLSRLWRRTVHRVTRV